MIDVNWDDNAKAAVKEFAEYVGQTKHCERYLERIVPKQTKTVADAWEWAGGKWGNSVSRYIAYNPNSNRFTYSETGEVNQRWYIVCTRAEFEAYVKEQECEKWTHVVDDDEGQLTKCRKHLKLCNGSDWVYVCEKGEYFVPSKMGYCGVKPIKPTMTKEQHEFLCKFSTDSNNLEVIAEVESYLAKHDIVEVPAND